MQLLFSTGKGFEVDGLREKLSEFFRQEASAELRRRGHYWVSMDIESEWAGGHLLSYQNFHAGACSPA